jgi:hypothetical protein
MDWKSFWKRETHVAIHAQSWRFRVMKYIVLLALAFGVYVMGGWNLLGTVFGILLVLSNAVHFFFRWKTVAWTKSWGPYKKIELPEN